VETDIDPRSLIGRKAFDRGGHKIGTVDEVYLDDATGVPEWAAVRTGLFSRDAFVPLEPSSLVDDTLRVPFERSLIKDAPDFGVGRHLSPEQEVQLYHHYGLALPTAGGPERPASPSDTDRERDFGKVAGQDD
jgi:sporulation protein YlmC with PRC-barrel domain